MNDTYPDAMFARILGSETARLSVLVLDHVCGTEVVSVASSRRVGQFALSASIMVATSALFITIARDRATAKSLAVVFLSAAACAGTHSAGPGLYGLHSQWYGCLGV